MSSFYGNRPGQRQVKRRDLLQAAGLTTFAALLAGCGPGSKGTTTTSGGSVASGGSASQRPKPGGTLVYGGPLQIATLDPAFSNIRGERYVLFAVCNSLVAFDPDYNIVPDLATSWKQDGDNLVLELRGGVKFHDGTEFNAEAVKINLDRILDPATNSPLRGALTPPLEQVEVVGPLTVRLKLQSPWRPLLSQLGERAGLMLSPAALQKYGKDIAKNPVGTGPYKFVSWEPGKEVAMERFDGYWGGRPHLDAIKMTAVDDIPALLTMLRTGAVDITDAVSARFMSTIRNDPKLVIHTKTGTSWTAAQVNLSRPPFDNLELRQALAHATDRDSIKQVAFQGAASVTGQPITLGWAHDAGYDYPLAYDMAAAKRLSAGASASGVLTFVTPNREPDLTIGQIAFNNYSQLGLKVEPQTVPADSWYADVKSGKTYWSTVSWALRADPDGLLRQLFHSKGSSNTTNFKDPKVDQLLDEAAVILDPDGAREKYFEIARRVVDSAPYAYMAQADQEAANVPDLGGVQLYGDGILRFRDMYYV